jgi:hypothetical protein
MVGDQPDPSARCTALLKLKRRVLDTYRVEPIHHGPT